MKKSQVIAGGLALAGGIAFVWSCGDATERDAPEVVTFRVSGAIFTTTVDGLLVNANIYEDKEDVYLDGGPGPNAPASAAGLPEGDYYFQVTDPSGQDLLSTDHISCRRVHVNAAGVIDEVYAGTNYEWSQGEWVPVPCQHGQGVDLDHSEVGAITVQLFPYDNTPNPGGVYKAWMTPVDEYIGDPDVVPEHHNDPFNGEGYEPGVYQGFVPSQSKTDNFKVQTPGKPVTPPTIEIKKFHDANFNGVQDVGEQDVDGWRVTVTDPIGAPNDYYTPAMVTTDTNGGTWGVTEEEREGTLVTASSLDGASQSSYPTASPSVSVEVAGSSGETHLVVFGNVGLGEITACKIFDRDGDGVVDDDEPAVPGWPFELTGTDASGAAVGPIQATTGEDGCTVFDDLLPGSYSVEEGQPGGGWTPTGETTQSTDITSSLDGPTIAGTHVELSFTNICHAEADFGTKGYWHNQNGLAEITDDDIEFVNGLAPYASASSYFDDGDEPFDGQFADGTEVSSSMGEAGEQIAPAGTSLAEISQFLVDPNAGGDPREQLAQQLLAFIFNTRHRLDDPGGVLMLPDGTYVAASTLVAQAIAVWESGSDEERGAMQGLLEGFNASDAVPYIPHEPCAVPST